MANQSCLQRILSSSPSTVSRKVTFVFLKYVPTRLTLCWTAPGEVRVLFERSKLETTAIGDMKHPAQEAFRGLLSGLFHFKLGVPSYSIKPGDYPDKPLFAPDDTNPYLNMMFWYVFDDMPNWQNMSELRRDTIHEIQELVMDEYSAEPAVAELRALPACPKLSKNLIAYLEALLVLTPYYRSADPRAQGHGDTQFNTALKDLNAVGQAPFKEYLARKLGEWYTAMPQHLLAPAAAGGGPDGDGGDAGVENSDLPESPKADEGGPGRLMSFD